MLALPLPRGPLAVAAGGLTASAVVVGLARALRRRRRARLGRRGRKELRRTVVGTRSFLVDVHLLGPLGRSSYADIPAGYVALDAGRQRNVVVGVTPRRSLTAGYGLVWMR